MCGSVGARWRVSKCVHVYYYYVVKNIMHVCVPDKIGCANTHVGVFISSCKYASSWKIVDGVCKRVIIGVCVWVYVWRKLIK